MPLLVRVCSDCGSEFSELLERAPAGMYSASYHQAMNGESEAAEPLTGAREQSQARLDLLRRFQEGGTLLDVGCSTGIFLELAQAAGFRPFGLDESEYGCQMARRRLGLNEPRIRQASAESGLRDWPAEPIDVITLWDVIEHLSQPSEALAQLVAALKPGGIVALRTPTTTSPFFRLAWSLYRMSGGRLSGLLASLYHADHVAFFSPRSLRFLLERSGLELLYLAPDPLLWKRFRYCECRRPLWLSLPIAAVYWLGRLAGQGHGQLAIARKPAI